MNPKTLAYRLASAIEARANCIELGNAEWQQRHSDTIRELCRELPHGSGFDNGSHIDLDRCTPTRLVFFASYHHMTEGAYSGWSEHVITATATFTGFDIRVSGRDRNEIKKYIAETFYEILGSEPELNMTQRWLANQERLACIGDEARDERKDRG